MFSRLNVQIHRCYNVVQEERIMVCRGHIPVVSRPTAPPMFARTRMCVRVFASIVIRNDARCSATVLRLVSDTIYLTLQILLRTPMAGAGVRIGILENLVATCSITEADWGTSLTPACFLNCHSFASCCLTATNWR